MLFPADPQTDLATLLDQIPSLSNFAALLKEWGTFPNSRRRYSSGRQSSESGASGTSSGRGEKLSGRVGAARVQDGGSGSGGGGDAETEFFTVFAPTNDALERLKTDRPWLFQNSSSVASSSDLDEESEWSPRRELLAYHLVPGGPLFSRCGVFCAHSSQGSLRVSLPSCGTGTDCGVPEVNPEQEWNECLRMCWL